MNETRWTAILHFGWLLILTMNTAAIARGQQAGNVAAASDKAADTKNANGTLKAIDQLIEQNRKLEQQNRELIQQNRELVNQINSLRPSVAKLDGRVQPALDKTSSSPVQSGSQGAAQ